MKAVFLDYATMGEGLDIRALRTSLPGIEIFDVTEAEQVAERIADAEIVLGNKVKLTADLLKTNPSLRYIGLTATGTDNVDLAVAKDNGIAVCNIRAYCTRSVAEHVFASLLDLTRNLSRYTEAVRAGEWQKSRDFCLLTYPVRELSAMTLGIIGFGDLGKGVASVAKAFGMNVIVAARPGAASVPEGRTNFDDVVKTADVISLHCPLNAGTTNLFDEQQFKKMRSGAILVNTARGGLINSSALVAALENGEIAAAAIDVLPQEPPKNGDPLLDYKGSNLILTPHIAWASDEARQNAIDQLVDCVSAFIEGKSMNRVA